MASLFLSAAHKSSGKTTLSIGLCAALKNRGLSVQPFKKGPDYIDPIWLGMAAGKPCYNLDFFVAGHQETVDDYCHRAHGADLSLVEGNKGLYDGIDLDGSNSNAALARAIQSPVILVIDVRGTMRGIGRLLGRAHGRYRQDPKPALVHPAAGNEPAQDAAGRVARAWRGEFQLRMRRKTP